MMCRDITTIADAGTSHRANELSCRSKNNNSLIIVDSELSILIIGLLSAI